MIISNENNNDNQSLTKKIEFVYVSLHSFYLDIEN